MRLFRERFAPLPRTAIGLAWLLLATTLLLSPPSSKAFALTITDLAGRTVELQAPAKRIILDPYAIFPALSLVDPDAADLVVGIGALAEGDLFEADLALKDKPRLGWIVSQTFSVEKSLELEPDLLIATTATEGKQKPLEDAFAAAGIPIIYVDFTQDPVENTVRSIEIIASAIGEEERAKAFVAFYRDHITRITNRLEAANPPRTTFLVTPRVPGTPCCYTMTRGGMGSYFGGRGLENIAEGLGAGGNVQLSLEYIIEKDPKVYIATDLWAGPRSLFGRPRSLARAVAELDKLRSEPGLSELSVMREGRLHLVDVTLTRSPLNILVIENVAKWTHPELFGDIDPQATLDEINRRFLAKPLIGPFWASVDSARDSAAGSIR